MVEIYSRAISSMENHQYSPTLHTQVRATLRQYGDIGNTIVLVAQHSRAQFGGNDYGFSRFLEHTKFKLDQLEELGEETTYNLQTLFEKRHYIFMWKDYIG